MPKTAEKGSQWRRWFLMPQKKGRGLMFLMFWALAVMAVMVAYMAAYAEKIVPGVKIVGLEVGNLSGEEAADLVAQRLEDGGWKELSVSYGEREWVIDGGQIGVEVNLPATIDQAWLIARSGNFWERLGQAQRSFFEGINLPLRIIIDETAWLRAVASISTEVEVEEIEPVLRIEAEGEKKQVVYEPGRDGLEVDEEDLKLIMMRQWQWLNNDRIKLPVRKLTTPVSEESLERAQGLAGGLLGKSLKIVVDGGEWILNEEEMVGLVSIADGEPDGRKVAEKVSIFAEGVNREPQNAVFRFEGGRVVEFAPGRDGIIVEEEELVREIVRVLGDFGEDKVWTLSAPVVRKGPAVTMAEVNNLGIKELLGRGKSSYLHSIPNRVYNILLTAKRIGGTLVAPGEVFSFNQSLGEVSRATGYKPAYVISDGRTILGDGGGVCQASTTLFRAVLSAGLPVIERKAHSYRVSYYEQDSRPGVDATVYDPSVDFKFSNDTPGHLLIQTVVNEAKMTLEFEIYGTNDGRIVEVSESKVWGQSAPPPPLYQDDPTLPEGVVKQIDWAAWGAKTSFEYKVTRGGEVLQDEVFYSNYRPWQAVYLRGTKRL